MIFPRGGRAVSICLLLVVTCVYFYVTLLSDGGCWGSHDAAFDSPLDEDDIWSLSRTVRVVTEALDAANVTYFLAAGTLLGSYRHHGRIPWDDDVDLAVSSADKPAVWNALKVLHPDYGLFLSGTMLSPYHWKVYPRRDGRPVPFRPFRWPFVDLIFFDENSTAVWMASPNLAEYRWRRRDVFPLVRRPFDGLWLPAPCDTAAVLRVNFDASMCRSRDFNHVVDLPMLRDPLTVQCRQLAARFPFVVRAEPTPTGSTGSRSPTSARSVAETLVVGSKTVHVLDAKSGC